MNIINNIKQILLRPPGNIVGIDIGSGSIKVAEVVVKNKRRMLQAYAITALPEGAIKDGRIADQQKVTACLRKTLNVAGVASKNAVIAISAQAAFAREVTYPSMNQEELKVAVKWDADKYVPYSPGTYYYDFSLIKQTEKSSEMQVLLVAAPYETVDSLVSICKAVNLKLLAIDIESLAIVRTFTSPPNSIIVDIGEISSQITIFNNGSPVVNRSLPLGGQRLTEEIMRVLNIDYNEADNIKLQQANIFTTNHADSNTSSLHSQLKVLIDELIREVRRTVDYYQMQSRSSFIDGVILTGGGAKMANLAVYMTEQLDMAVTVHNPLALLTYAAKFDKKRLSDISPQLAVAIGLGLRGSDE